MPLLELWTSNQSAISQLSIEQVLANAGDGNLLDGSICSHELRAYLQEITTEKLNTYIEKCIASSFPKSGMVLQDLVNELGRRLEYRVTNGRYQGTKKDVGFDGLWISPEGGEIIVEVKTTDAYRISLDTIASYRDRLTEEKRCTLHSSILIIVGREDTGELEAQVRGSRHAWDIRLISIDALSQLVELKEKSGSLDTLRKIRSVLIPVEYTRLDELIDVIFTTAKDAEAETLIVAPDEVDELEKVAEADSSRGTWQFTDPNLLDEKRLSILNALGVREKAPLIRKTRALYWNTPQNVRAACTISKRYSRYSPYWYAYHPGWDDFLTDAQRSFVVLGCMDRDVAYAIPVSILRQHLEFLNTSEKKTGGHYWHLHLHEGEAGDIHLQLPKKKGFLPLAEFSFSTKT